MNALFNAITCIQTVNNLQLHKLIKLVIRNLYGKYISIIRCWKHTLVEQQCTAGKLQFNSVIKIFDTGLLTILNSTDTYLYKINLEIIIVCVTADSVLKLLGKWMQFNSFN